MTFTLKEVLMEEETRSRIIRARPTKPGTKPGNSRRFFQFLFGGNHNHNNSGRCAVVLKEGVTAPMEGNEGNMARANITP